MTRAVNIVQHDVNIFFGLESFLKKQKLIIGIIFIFSLVVVGEAKCPTTVQNMDCGVCIGEVGFAAFQTEYAHFQTKMRSK